MKEWTGKQKFFKDGNPEVFKYFNYRVWSRMTEPERAQWTPFSEVELAPIPKEVIDFKEKENELSKAKAKIAELERMISEDHEKEIANDDLGDAKPPEDVTNETYELTEEEEKEKIKAQLSDLGIKYSHNSKLETLRKKLNDALDSE